LIFQREKIGSNVLDAISRGTTDGLKLAVNVGSNASSIYCDHGSRQLDVGDLIGDQQD
jgi:CNT family concentrative nucleoside transporter